MLSLLLILYTTENLIEKSGFKQNCNITLPVSFDHFVYNVMNCV